MPRRPPPETKTKVGRRSLLTEERAQELCDAVEHGNHLTVACALAGIGQSTLYAWIDRANRAEAAINNGTPYNDDDLPYLEFRDRLTRARAVGEKRVVSAVTRDILGGALVSREPIMESYGPDQTRVARNDDGEILYRESWTTPNGRVGLAFLSRSAPDRWGEKSRVEVTGADGDPLLGVPSGKSGGVEEEPPDVTGLVERLALVAKERREGVDLVEEPVDAELLEEETDG